MSSFRKKTYLGAAALIFLVSFQTEALAQDQYLEWASSFFGDSTVENEEAQVSVWGKNADPDGDQIKNLEEYAFGLSPTESSRIGDVMSVEAGVRIGTSTPYIRLSATLRKDDPALHFIPQYSPSLGSVGWLPDLSMNAIAEGGTSDWFVEVDRTLVDTEFDRITYELVDPGEDLPRAFARLLFLHDLTTVATPGIDPLLFTANENAAAGGTVESNSVVLSGFVGSVEIVVDGGASIYVDGENRGSRTTAQNGSSITLSASNPSEVDVMTIFNVQIGDYETTWRLGSRAIESVALPAGTASGYTPVEVRSSEGGAAQISIPIVVSPGTGGIQPELSIGYSSQGGNGPLGQGFSLSGIPTISRTGQTVSQDGKKTGVSLSYNDRYTLDGQRLIAILGSDGGNNSKYRTELDSYSEIVSGQTVGSGPSRWRVRSKSGLTYRFGYSTDSRIFPEDSNTIAAWSVNEISDSVGNYMKFTYDSAARLRGESLITRIEYTLNSSAGLSPTQEVLFFYEDRPDTRKTYLAGHAMHSSKRLIAIESKQNGQRVRRYDIAYLVTPTGQPSKVSSVTETGINGMSFPPTVFDWDLAAYPDLTLIDDVGFDRYPAFDQDPPAQMVNGDYNGDGLMDLIKLNDHGIHWIALSNGDGTFEFSETIPGLDGRQMSSSNRHSRVRTGDFNADGLTDILHIFSSGATSFLAYSNGDGTFNTLDHDELGGLTDVGFAANSTSEVLAMDYNGDGRTDIAILNGNWDHFVALSDPDSVFIAVEDTGELEGNRIWDSSENKQSWILPGDYNGDGLGDILHLLYTAERHWLALSNGDGTFTVVKEDDIGGIGDKNFAIQYSYFTTGDFNGDGLTDIFNLTEHKGQNWMGLSKGNGDFELIDGVPGMEQANGSTGGPRYSEIYSVDVNGDGLTDIFHAHHDRSVDGWIAVATGNGAFDLLPNGQMSALDDHTYDTGFITSRVFPGDYNGDGISDVMHLKYSGVHWNALSSTGVTNRVQKVTNGHGGYTKLVYKPLTDPAIYTKGNNAVYPCHDFVAPIYVVTELTTRNGVDGNPYTNAGPHSIGESSVSYKYEEAWMCLDGRGFRGFKCIETTNQVTGIVTRTKYDERPLVAGRPVSSETRLDDDTLISESEGTWELNAKVHPTENTTYEVRQTESISRDYEINTGALVRATSTTYDEFDEFGNVERMSVNYGNGYSETTVSEYDNSATSAKWHLGRLRTSTVTKTAPNAPNVSRTSSFIYDGNTGLLVTEVIEPGDPSQALQKVYQHDTFGNIVQSTITDSATGDSRTTASAYSSDGRFEVQTTNSLGHRETKTFDPLLGNVLSQTGPNSISTIWEYDGFGRPTREYRLDGTETKTSYHRATAGVAGAPPRSNHLVLAQTSGGEVKRIYYDVLDREIATRLVGFDGTLILGSTVYNERGEVPRKSDPYYTGEPPLWTDTTYDAIGRAVSQTSPGNRTSTTIYGGLTTEMINPANQRTIRTVNARGKVVEVIDNLGAKIHYAHDSHGNPLVITDDAGNSTVITYDTRGNKTSITEPNSGTTFFEYNNFGGLVRQEDAKGQVVNLAYDKLGRLIRRMEAEGESTWTYDTARKGIGKIASESGPSGFEKLYLYDNFGRPASTITSITGKHYSVSTSFDQYSRPHTTTYPTGYAVRSIYNAFGYLTEVRTVGTSELIWEAKEMTARGQLRIAETNSGINETTHSYARDTGLLQRIQVSSGGNTHTDNSYQYDGLNNLVNREWNALGLIESFDYDWLNRLTNVASTGMPEVTMTYDPLGNILSKSDVGTYAYGENGAGPNALSAISGSTTGRNTAYSYDANGNQIGGAGRIVEFSSFNKPVSIEGDGGTVEFAYAPDRSRFQQFIVRDQEAEVRHYIGGLYEFEEHGDHERHVHYVRGGGGVVLAHVIEVRGGNHETKDNYLHRDHLGSVETITDEAGNVVERLNYDAWGRRRGITADGRGGWDLSYDPVTLVAGVHRGFTGHEMLDEVGLVHMNGRVYDPVTGRFLSPDPFVQAPEDLQNLNRYSYVMNNPLSFTDPSGFFFKKILKAVGKFLANNSSWLQLASKFLHFIPGIGTLAAAAIDSAITFGAAFSGTLLAGGSFGDALKAGLKAHVISNAQKLAFNYVGSQYSNGVISFEARVVAHGVISGAGQKAMGGQFKHGFYSGAFSASFSPLADRVRADLGRSAAIATSALIGGTASELGGGKFANGAVSGAMIRIYNDEAHWHSQRTEYEGFDGLAEERFDITTEKGINRFAVALSTRGATVASISSNGKTGLIMYVPEVIDEIVISEARYDSVMAMGVGGILLDRGYWVASNLTLISKSATATALDIGGAVYVPVPEFGKEAGSMLRQLSKFEKLPNGDYRRLIQRRTGSGHSPFSQKTY